MSKLDEITKRLAKESGKYVYYMWYGVRRRNTQYSSLSRTYCIMVGLLDGELRALRLCGTVVRDDGSPPKVLFGDNLYRVISEDRKNIVLPVDQLLPQHTVVPAGLSKLLREGTEAGDLSPDRKKDVEFLNDVYAAVFEADDDSSFRIPEFFIGRRKGIQPRTGKYLAEALGIKDRESGNMKRAFKGHLDKLTNEDGYVDFRLAYGPGTVFSNTVGMRPSRIAREKIDDVSLPHFRIEVDS